MGIAKGSPIGLVKAIRIRPSRNLGIPLVIREIEFDANPAITGFTYPIEFFFNIKETPELKDWVTRMERACELNYPIMAEELSSDDFVPIRMYEVIVKRNFEGDGVVRTVGSEMTWSAQFVKANPNDVGLMMRMMVFSLQNYRNTPQWLRSGVADYIRYYRFEPKKIRPIAVGNARHDRGNEITAAFLAYVADKYEPQIVKKLNAKLREADYNDNLWKEFTGKTVMELDREWKDHLSR